MPTANGLAGKGTISLPECIFLNIVKVYESFCVKLNLIFSLCIILRTGASFMEITYEVTFILNCIY